MSNTFQLPKTLQEAVALFSDPSRTFDYAVKLRWPDGKVRCPRCDSTEHSFISTRHIWFCKGCKKQFTVKVGTIFEDSPIGMDKWMVAVWLIVNAKNGISSYEIGRALGVTQKSAWFMMHRVRLALHNKDVIRLGGDGKEVEVDETFIGGAARFMHADKRKLVTTQGAKRHRAAVLGIQGTYVSVEPFHLFRYLDEQVFRCNNRAMKDCFIGDGDLFRMAMQHIANRRLAYQELTGKGADTVHHETAR